MQVDLYGRLSLEMQSHTWSRHPLIIHSCAQLLLNKNVCTWVVKNMREHHGLREFLFEFCNVGWIGSIKGERKLVPNLSFPL